MRPDVDDLVVALARGNDTLTVLLLHIINFLLGGLNLLPLLGRYDHVIDTDRSARFRGFLEAQLLELVQCHYGPLLAGKFVGVPDQFAELALGHREVRETNFLGPNFTEHHAAGGGGDYCGFLVAVHGIFATIRIGQVNT